MAIRKKRLKKQIEGIDKAISKHLKKMVELEANSKKGEIKLKKK